MSDRQFRITFRKGGQTRTLVYPGHTAYDAERDFTTDHPDAEVLTVIEDTVSIRNTFNGTSYGTVNQMGDVDGDVNYFRG
jgi:hypothetical protein